MKATATRTGTYKHVVQVRQHRLQADEPHDTGGEDSAPSPQELLAASLASCTAITMEMYAERKGWDVGDLEVVVEADTGAKPARFEVLLKLPESLDDEQARRLQVIAHKCPIHRILLAEAEIVDRIERV